ncbi:YtxH domain-containing protein [Candidatus Saccharibacteria bacterium]|nr:YtxH domain-containing protein [Candidatus Saccharibacteria bacterium]
MAKGKKFGLGLLIGAVAGTVAGILTAPKSGKETRRDLKKKADEAKGAAERKLKDAHKELAKLSDDAKAQATKLKGKAKKEMEELAKKADELKEKVKAAITSIKSGDDDSDDATVDQLLKDLKAIQQKITTKAKELKK